MNRKILRWVAIPVAIVLCIATLKWEEVQGVATILLLLVTFEYVLLTQQNIELFRRQLQRQEKVYANFELICRSGPLFVRVANLGISNFLVAAIHVRTQDEAEFHYPTQEIVESGKSVEIDLPGEVCAGHPLSVDLEITLQCVGLDTHGNTEPQVFTVNMGLGETPADTKRGFDGLWSITCPRCKKGFGGLLAMSTKGLKTFDEAFNREKRVLRDFQDSCPNHESEFLLKMDEVKEQG
jgi:hypothetical protein